MPQTTTIDDKEDRPACSASSLAPTRQFTVTSFLMRPRQLAVLILLLYSYVAIAHLCSQHWDITRFIVAGDRFADETSLIAPIAITPNSPGYDGEFYYRLGLDPFTSQRTAFGITLDNPATRGARIGYPLLAWMFSFGQPWLLPWVMVGLNVLGMFAIAWMSMALAQFFGVPVWLGLAPAFYPGFLLTIVRDTTEICAITFGLAALCFAVRRQYWRALPLAAFAVITRETTLFYMAGFGVVELINCIRQRRWSWSLLALALPALVFFSWQYFIILHWEVSSYSGTSQNIGLPFVGLIGFFTTAFNEMRQFPWMSFDFKLRVYYMLSVGMCLALSGLAGFQAATGRANPGLRVSLALYVALVMCLTTAIWVQPYDYLRAFSDCFVVGATVIMLSSARWSAAALLAIIVPMWLLTERYI